MVCGKKCSVDFVLMIKIMKRMKIWYITGWRVFSALQ